jgi:tetratricopeptide (TPR) repeat protein
VGELWVTDFGLARFQEDLGLTHTGDVLGTLRYMSPEQALGRKTIIDHRADLYSLGATLYELVTLKPPFDAKNRQALLRQIAEDEPVSPGRINPRVPRDLQTIVLKAMAKDPSQRYASAEELAEDLRRFQEDRPILARRPSVIERSARWARRHRTLVASSFVFLFLLAVGSGIAATLLWQERRNISETLAQSLHSVSELLEMSEAQQRLAEDYALDTKHLPRLQDLATRTLGVYERLAARNPRDRESRFQIARAYSRVASILDRAGREPDGLAARQKAEPILAAIVREQPAGTSYAQEYAEVLLALAESDLGAKPARMDDADRRLNEALELLNPGGNAAPADAKRARLLASCYHLRGGSFGMRAKNNERMESWVKARDVLETAVKSHPEDPELRLELAHLLHDIGQYYRFSARSSEARESLEEAITNLDQLIETDPDDPKYRELAAENYFVLSCPMVQGANGKSDVASRACARAVEEWLRLIRDFPQIPKYREDFVGKLTFLLPLSHMYTGEWTDVERIEQVAREQLEWLRERYPRNESYKQLQIQTLYNIMRLWAGNGRPKEALPRAEEILKLEPNAISALNDVAWYLAITTNLEERDLAQAETLLRRVLAVQSDSSPIWNSLGMVLLRQERYDECVQVLEKAIALPGGACGENWYLLAAALKRQGKPEEARRLYDKAEEAYKAQKYPNPDLKTCRNEAAQALGISLPAEAPQPFDVAL